MSYLAGTTLQAEDIPDDLSLAASSTIGSTLMTRYTSKSMNTLGTGATRRTSKNKRREERKRARGKKGSVYEEEYLVASTSRLFDRINDISDEVRGIVDALFRRRMRERAVAVQTSMLDVIALCQHSREEVFQVTGQQQLNTMANGIINDGAINDENGTQSVVENNQTEITRANAPTIKSFAKLSLLS